MLSKPCAIAIRFIMHSILFVFQKAVKMLIDNVDKVPVSMVAIWSYTQMSNKRFQYQPTGYYFYLKCVLLSSVV